MTWEQIYNMALDDFIVPAVLAYMGLLLTRLVNSAESRFGLQKDAAHNAALTNAVVTYAGLAIDQIRKGHYSLQDVKDGKVTADMVKYLCTTVGGAMAHFQKPPEDLTQMLVGKIATLPGAGQLPDWSKATLVGEGAAVKLEVPASTGSLIIDPAAPEPTVKPAS